MDQSSLVSLAVSGGGGGSPLPPLDFNKVITPKLVRLVKQEKMAMHPKRLASISDISVFNAFISSGSRKLNYRRLEGIFL